MNLNKNLIEAICFDVDGTISDTDDLYVNKLARLLNPFQIFLKDRNLKQLARRFIMSVETPVNFLMGLPDVIGLDEEIYALMNFLSKRSHHKPKRFLVIPGIRDLLEDLYQKYPLAVVTARDERTTRLFFESTKLDKYFQFYAYAQTCRHTKPYPDPILWATGKIGVDPMNCLMVGDTTVDIQSGRSAGAQTVGVLCGFGEQEELIRKGANLILETTADLAVVLN